MIVATHFVKSAIDTFSKSVMISHNSSREHATSCCCRKIKKMDKIVIIWKLERAK